MDEDKEYIWTHTNLQTDFTHDDQCTTVNKICA